MKQIILASSSPRRRNILKKLNVKFKVIPSPFVEKHTATDFAYQIIEDLAFSKADATTLLLNEPAFVIGADTMVILGRQILGKPKDRNDAIKMLQLLSDREHMVVTSVCIIDSVSGEHKTVTTKSYVRFNKLSTEQIKAYVDQFKPYDKAGAYGIQELPDGFLNHLSGSLENVIGLDGNVINQLLTEFQRLYP